MTLDATRADWPAVFHEAEAGTVPLDAVVFVAGAAVFGETRLIPEDQARATFELNFWACAAAARAAAERFAASGKGGTFLAVLSIAGRRAVPQEAYYGAGKAAAARFLECLQLEHDRSRVRILAAYPGLVRTSFRDRAAWFGPKPHASTYGTEPEVVARAIADLLTGRRRARLIGWRERAIDLADRLLPGLYDRLVLEPRLRRGR